MESSLNNCKIPCVDRGEKKNEASAGMVKQECEAVVQSRVLWDDFRHDPDC